MNKKYILSKAKRYAYITTKNRVTKTESMEKATVFTKEEAQKMLNWANKKLKGFIMVQVNEPSLTATEEATKGMEIPTVSRKVFSQTTRNDIYERTKGRCALCGKFIRFDQFTVDHIIPLAKGGTNDIENLQCTCKQCNAMKQDLSEDEFLDKLFDIFAYQFKKKENKTYKKKIKKLCK